MAQCSSAFEPPCGPYIQVAWSADGDIVAEVSSNRVLDPEFRIRKPERRLLREAGWSRPDEDHPNYWMDVDSTYSDHAADMLITAMRDVFGSSIPCFSSTDSISIASPPARMPSRPLTNCRSR